MLLEITRAEYLGDYKVQLAFSDKQEGTVDLRALIDECPQSVFAAFADEIFARSFELAHGTLCWPGECDVAAEYLYFLAFRNMPALVPLFRQWGYMPDTALAA